MENKEKYNLGKFNTTPESAKNTITDSLETANHKTKYNRGKFNTSPVSATKLIVDFISNFALAAPFLKRSLKAEVDTFISKFTATSTMVGWLNLWTDIKSKFDSSAKMTVAFNVKDTVFPNKFTMSEPPLQSMLSTYIDLLGITLNPGETLIIDCENLNIQKNGIDVVEYWQLGSDFFEMTAGENVFSYFDSDSKRNIEFTVQWKNRWL